MKKLFVLILITILAFFSGCSRTDDNTKPDAEKPARGKFKRLEDRPGFRLIVEGRLGRAFEYFNNVLQKNPDEYYAHLGKGIIYQKRVEYDDALKQYNRAVEIDPENPLAYVERGRLLIVMKGGINKARQDFDTALKLDPQSSDAKMGVSMISMFKEEYGRANEYLDKVIKSLKNPDHPGHYNLYQERGYARYYLKRYDDALADFSKSIEIGPKRIYTSTSYVGRALTYFRMKKMNKAIEDLDRIKNTVEIITLHTEYQETNKILFYKGDLEKTLKISRLAYQAFPMLYVETWRYGVSLNQFGRVGKARRIFKKASKLKPKHPEAYVRLAHSRLITGSPEKAGDLLKKAMNLPLADDFDVQSHYVDFLIDTGRLKDAERITRKLYDNAKPGSESAAYALVQLSRIYLLRGKADKASQMLKKAAPKGLDAHAFLIHHARIALFKNRLDKAGKIIDKLRKRRIEMEFDANDVEVLYALLLYKKGQTGKSIKHLGKTFKKEYPSRIMYWLRYWFAKDPLFRKMKDDPQVEKALKSQWNRLVEIYKKGGCNPAPVIF